jgi:hypothetical protein
MKEIDFLARGGQTKASARQKSSRRLLPFMKHLRCNISSQPDSRGEAAASCVAFPRQYTDMATVKPVT